VERLLRKGYEVLFLIEPVDEYCIQSLPEFEGKKFQNVAKEGLNIEQSEKAKKKFEELEKTYEPLLKWLKDDGLKDLIEKATLSQRLTDSPMALVASSYGWSGNMERIMRSQAYAKAKDPSQEEVESNTVICYPHWPHIEDYQLFLFSILSYYANQKKTLEVNPRHPLVKKLLDLVEKDSSDQSAKDLSRLLFETANMRSGYQLKVREK
jgi:heat shock protein beta